MKVPQPQYAEPCTRTQAGAGHSLELSTAGLQAEFTITAKDLYGNLRGVGGDNFKVSLHPHPRTLNAHQ